MSVELTFESDKQYIPTLRLLSRLSRYFSELRIRKHTESPVQTVVYIVLYSFLGFRTSDMLTDRISLVSVFLSLPFFSESTKPKVNKF